MLSPATLPEYLSISPQEKGGSLNLSFDQYRHLARTSLSITKDIPSVMAIYRLPEQRGCVLDIFLPARCLSIAIDSEANTLGLFFSDLDSLSPPTCLLNAGNSPEELATPSGNGSRSSAMKATPLCLSCNAIHDKRFIVAGDILDADTIAKLPASIKRYLVSAESSDDQEPQETTANFQLGQSYAVDRNDRLRRRNIERQANEQFQAAAFADAIEEELEKALANPDEQTKAALEVAEENHQAAVGLEMAQRAYTAKEREATDQAAKDYIAEQDAMLVDENPVSPTIEEQIPQPESDWKPQPKRMRKRYICRNGVWLRAKRIKRFRPAEKVYVRNGVNDFEQIGVVNKQGHLPAAYI